MRIRYEARSLIAGLLSLIFALAFFVIMLSLTIIPWGLGIAQMWRTLFG